MNTTKETGHSTHQRTKTVAREERDDEQEFNRIPIAGEDSEDYQNEYWETQSDEDKDSGHESNEEEHDNENKTIFTTNMNRIVSPPPTTPLPIVEPLPYSHAHELTGVPMTASMTPGLSADDIAYMIGHADGIIHYDQFTPIPKHVNLFDKLSEVNDKVHFTQNMHGMMKGEHKQKLTKSQRQMDESAKDSDLLLFSFLPSASDDESRGVLLQDKPTKKKKSAHKSRRLHTSPITIPGTPDYSNETEPKRPRRFPYPNYDHRNTNYQQPPLTDRLSLDDLLEDWPPESLSPLHPKRRIITESQFDFSSEC